MKQGIYQMTRIAPALAVCLALLSSTAYSAEKRLDKTFTVTPGGKLMVDADGSDVAVTGGDSNQVVVQIVATGSQRELDRLTLSAEQTADGVVVTAKDRSGSWPDWFHGDGRKESSVKIAVPRRYSVDLRTSGGDLVVAQLQGEALGKTSGGDVRVDDVNGGVTMRTYGGDISIKRVEGDTKVHTLGGNITVHTVNGNIVANTSGGDVDLREIKGTTRADTSGGDVVARNVRGDTELESASGNIEAEMIDGRIDARTLGGDVTVELVGANRGISVSTSGGSVVVRVPKNTTGALSASTSSGSITSDLPVTAAKISERKMNGLINGGGPAIEARSLGGDIKLLARD